MASCLFNRPPSSAETPQALLQMHLRRDSLCTGYPKVQAVDEKRGDVRTRVPPPSS